MEGSRIKNVVERERIDKVEDRVGGGGKEVGERYRG